VPAGPPDDAVDAVVADGQSDVAGRTAAGNAEINMVKSNAVVDTQAAASSTASSTDATTGSVKAGGEREAELVGAVSAGSARAAARRSGARAGSTPVKGAATRARDTGRDDRSSMFARLRRFFREVVAELRKVIWPARNQMITYTIVVIVFVVIMVAITAGLDLLFAKGVLAVFG
jgi:preprotein translocase subunit SecE